MSRGPITHSLDVAARHLFTTRSVVQLFISPSTETSNPTKERQAWSLPHPSTEAGDTTDDEH